MGHLRGPLAAPPTDVIQERPEHLIFLEDVSGEIDMFEDPKVLPAIPASPLPEDVSGETLIFSKRGLKAAFSTSHFFEDVSGESPIFEDPEIRPAISTSPFCEDVSGETLIFSIRRLKR